MPLQPALLGGLFIGVLSALPVVSLGNCCCLWIIGGGMLAAYLDQAPGRGGNLARGALDGLMAGIIGAFVYLIASSAINTVMAPLQNRFMDSLISGAYDLPPDVRDWIEAARNREGGFFRELIGFVFQLGASVIFSTLGGLLGALFFWRGDAPPALGGPPAPPPLPPP